MSRTTYMVAVFILVSRVGFAQPVADRFDYPVGPPDGTGYYNARDFGVLVSGLRHLAEDWNGVGGGNTDLGDPVYAVANGTIKYASNAGKRWGNVIIIVHRLTDGREIASMYAHLAVMIRTSGTVSRGEQIGTIGRGYDYGGGQFDYQNSAHLHFEVRTDTSIGSGPGYSRNTSGWTDPSDFIDDHRSPSPPVPIPSCSYTLSPTTHTVLATGGTGSTTVTASPSGCSGSWTATSNTSFITVTSGSSGTASGTVRFSVASNSSTTPRTGTLTIAGQTFTTTQQGATPTPVAPTVTTSTASGIGPNAATLNGTVNPNGLAASAYFQWGTTTSYGNTTASQSIGNGTSAIGVTANLAGLSSSSVYHYRLIATNSIGTTNGGDIVFTTGTASPPNVSATATTQTCTLNSSRTQLTLSGTGTVTGPVGTVFGLGNGWGPDRQYPITVVTTLSSCGSWNGTPYRCQNANGPSTTTWSATATLTFATALTGSMGAAFIPYFNDVSGVGFQFVLCAQ